MTLPGVVILNHLGNGLVVALDHTDRVWTPRVQVVYISRQGDGDHVLATPETAQLLVFNLIPHVEGCDGLVRFHVPQLARFVAGCRQEALVVSAPRDGVDSAGVSVFTLGLEFGNLKLY